MNNILKRIDEIEKDKERRIFNSCDLDVVGYIQKIVNLGPFVFLYFGGERDEEWSLWMRFKDSKDPSFKKIKNFRLNNGKNASNYYQLIFEYINQDLSQLGYELTIFKPKRKSLFW